MFVCMYEGAFITFIMMWNWETSSSSNTKKIVCEERAKDQMAIFAFAEDWSDKIVSSHCNIKKLLLHLIDQGKMVTSSD